MTDSIYIGLTRQAALLDELKTIATNVANASTAGYRTERLVFSEYVKETQDALGSVSMATARARYASAVQGELTPTGGQFDLAIEGDGFFQVDTPQGARLTRAGAFSLSAENTMVTVDGYTLLGEGGAPVFVPADANQIAIANDGAVSVDGQPIGRIELVTGNLDAMTRDAGTLFTPGPDVVPVDAPKIAQGFLEASNVTPIEEISRMIEVQRAYESGQSIVRDEDDRIRSAIDVLGQPV